jgi:large subunit ribosomal protein L14
MLQIGSSVKVIDNSGAKIAQCIHVITPYKSDFACIGDLILISIRKVRKNRADITKISKGKIFRAIVLRTKKFNCYIRGNKYKFLENGVVLLTNQNKLVATRIFGPVTKNFRYTKYLKLLIVSAGIII